MSQRGPASYGFQSGPPSYGAAPSQEPAGSFLDQLRPYTSKVEDFLDTVSEPVKP